MTRRLWLDDVRPAPPGWFWVKTVNDMKTILRREPVSEISLDYDLHATDGWRKGIEVLAFLLRHPEIPVPFVHIHTANSEGARQMTDLWRKLEVRSGRPRP